MTSTPVKNVGVGAGGLMPVNTKNASGSGFQKVWDSRMQKQDTGSPGGENARAIKKTPGDSLRARDEHRARTEKREPSRNVEERTDIPEEKLAEAEGVLTAAAEGMLQEIAELLGVDAEEIASGMAELDMGLTDLLNSGKLGELLLHVRGAGDASALLTDEGIYGDYRKLTAMLEETLQESAQSLESSPEEMAQLLERLKAAEEPGTAVISADTPAELSGEESEIVVEIVDERGNDSETAVKTEEKSREASTAQTTTGQIAEETEAQGARGKSESGRGGRENHRGGDSEQGGNLLIQNLKAEQLEARNGAAQISESAGSAETENIMRQIMDYMKINLKPEISSMEMQLHPASLGTLQIQIASKGGVITANFLTQNEAVKAALESQMVHLKEQFAEQGVRVEAIEVTVQTHEFERNLDQGREGGGQNRESARKGRGRRLRLDGIQPGEETRQEPSQAAELSAGESTVDYMA